MTLAKRRIMLIISILIFPVISAAAILYAQGYRLGDSLNFIKTGGIYISSPESGSEIFLNKELEKETNILQSGVFMQNLKAGVYSIIVAKNGFWPWEKNLAVKEKQVTEVRAFMIPLEVKGRVVMKGPFTYLEMSPYQNILLLEEESPPTKKRLNFYLPDEDTFLTQTSATTTRNLSFQNELKKIEWKDGNMLFADEKGAFKAVFDMTNDAVSATKSNESIQSSNSEKISRRGLERIKIDPGKNEIWAEWLGNEESRPYYFPQNKMLVLQSRNVVRNADFFPGRRDIIIAAIDNGIFAIELDGRDKRNLQPIYKGRKPLFAASQNKKALYVLDGNTLIQIDLAF